MQFRLGHLGHSSSVAMILAASFVTIFLSESSLGRTDKTSLRTSNLKSVEELRLIVSFNRHPTSIAREKLHERLGGNLKKHFSSINADLVSFSLPRQNSSKLVASLCAKYLRQAEIKSCELDYKVEFPFQRECTLTPSSNSEALAALPQIVQQSNNQRCEVVPTQGMISAQDPERAGSDGTWGVSPLWGQQVVGADLAAEFVSQRLQSGRASRVPTGNMDIISDRTPAAPVQADALKLNLLGAKDASLHGDSTANLVSNPPFGASPAVTWSAIVSLADQTKPGTGKEAWNSNVIDGLEAIGRTQTRVVTASIGVHGTSPRAAIDSFVDKGRMFVKASGNDYPEVSLNDVAPRVGHIVVGSVGPNGIQSPFSQEPAKIYAPADASQLSGPNHRFGGTSGAAPLVTGSIVNALAILPHLSNSEIEELLARTSLPSFSQQAAGYGPGLLNSYRMAVVSACLADKSKDQRQKSMDASCFDQRSKAQELHKEAYRLLKNTSCVNQRDGLKTLRASFLLHPSRDSALQIAEIYERLGFPGDARWYKTAAASLGAPEQQRSHFDELLNEPSLTSHRYFAGSNIGVVSKGFYALSLASRMPSNSPYVKTTIERISTLARSTNPTNQEQAIEQALIVGPRALPAIAHLLVDGEDDEDPRSAKRIIWKLAASDSAPHPWTKETEAYFKGTPFEKHLPGTD